MKALLRLISVLSFVVLAAAVATQDDEVNGVVTRLQGNAVAMQDAVPRPLKIGDNILSGDVISTGKDARLELRMIDDGVITLGERTVFVVIDYILGGEAPNAAVRLLQGAFKTVSGQLMQQANAKFVVETEVATIGIRGTTFWGGTLDDTFDVALLAGKGIYVETKAGRVDITTPGEGTSIRAAGDAPSPPKAWPKAKVDRAVDTVTFR